MGMPKSHPTHSFVLCHDHDIIQTSLWTSQHGLPSELQDQLQVLQIMLKKALVAVKVSLSHDRTEYVFGIHQSVILVGGSCVKCVIMECGTMMSDWVTGGSRVGQGLLQLG